MAIAYANAASFDASFNNAGDSVTNAFDAGAGSDRFLAVSVNWHNSGAHTMPDAGVTYNGTTLTAFGATVVNTATALRCYYLTAPATGSNNLVVDPAAGVATNNAIITAISFSGVDQSTPFDGYTSASGTDTTAELTITSATDDAPVFFAGARVLSPVSWAPTNYTERADNINTNMMATVGEGTGAASVACTGTISATAVNAWVAMGFNLNVAAATGSYTLTAEPGSFAITGTDANLEAHRVVEAESGSVALTGTDANLEVHRVLTAETQSVAITGTDASLRKGIEMAAEPGTFEITGTDASLEYNRVLEAESGSIAVTGTDATLTYSGDVVPQVGSGGGTAARWPSQRDRELLEDWLTPKKKKEPKKKALKHYTMKCEVAECTVAGMPAMLITKRRVKAKAGAFKIVGQNAALHYDRIVEIEGVDADVLHGAKPGVYSLSIEQRLAILEARL